MLTWPGFGAFTFGGFFLYFRFFFTFPVESVSTVSPGSTFSWELSEPSTPFRGEFSIWDSRLIVSGLNRRNCCKLMMPCLEKYSVKSVAWPCTVFVVHTCGSCFIVIVFRSLEIGTTEKLVFDIKRFRVRSQLPVSVLDLSIFVIGTLLLLLLQLTGLGGEQL